MISKIVESVKKYVAVAAVIGVGIWTILSEWDEMMAERASECVTINKDHVIAEKTEVR